MYMYMVFLLCLSIQVILINAYFQLLKLSNYFTNVLMRDLFSVVAFFVCYFVGILMTVFVRLLFLYLIILSDIPTLVR
jgi:hypothetical protein